MCLSESKTRRLISEAIELMKGRNIDLLLVGTYFSFTRLCEKIMRSLGNKSTTHAQAEYPWDNRSNPREKNNISYFPRENNADTTPHWPRVFQRKQVARIDVGLAEFKQ